MADGSLNVAADSELISGVITTSSAATTTITVTAVLVGITGSGKSATGNSILGRKAFKSMTSFDAVTSICQQEEIVVAADRLILSVIDTPGLFDSSGNPEMIKREIVRCIMMAKDGIHAILMVVSLKVRFTDEQLAAIDTLKHLFGSRILDYMILVFTGGDELEEDESTLDSHLARCPHSLEELIENCGNRKIVFDNKTKDEAKKATQRHQLFALVGDTVKKNGGKPYTLDSFLQHKVDEKQNKRKIGVAADEEIEQWRKRLKEADEEMDEWRTRLKEAGEGMDEWRKRLKEAEKENVELKKRLEEAKKKAEDYELLYNDEFRSRFGV